MHSLTWNFQVVLKKFEKVSYGGHITLQVPEFKNQLLTNTINASCFHCLKSHLSGDGGLKEGCEQKSKCCETDG